MDLKQIITELEKIKRDLPKEAEKIALKYKSKILDYIREDQLFNKGIDGKGNKLTPDYKPFTIAIKKQKGQPVNRVTLNDTGMFYDGFDLIYTDQNSIGVFSRDSKTPEIVEKYGSDIFTFTANNIKEIDTEIFETKLIEWILQSKIFTMI